MNLQTGLALLVSAAAGFNEAAADISDFTYMGSPGACVDSQQQPYNAYGLSGQVVTNQTNDARKAAEWCESAGPLLPTFVGFFVFVITTQPILIQFGCLYSGSLPTPDPNYTPPHDDTNLNNFGVGSIAGVDFGPGGSNSDYSCYRYNGFTTSPTDAPISSPPTKAPVTASPTDAPVSSPPTKAPVTVSPTKAPVSSSPTKAPVTVSPTKAPVSSSPTKAPVTASPSAAPVTSSPSSAPVTASPSAAPVTSSPSSAPVTSPPTKMPAVSSKSSKISKSLSPNSKSTKNAKKV